jgi:hypothetical protein
VVATQVGGALAVPGNKRRHAETTSLLLHHLLESLARRDPDARFERNVTGAPATALIGPRDIPATPLTAAIVVPLARMITSRGAGPGAGALVTPRNVPSPTGVQPAADMGVGEDRIPDGGPRPVRCGGVATGGKPGECGER